MTSRDFRLLTARISLTEPIGKKPAIAVKPEHPRVSEQRRVAEKPAR